MKWLILIASLSLSSLNAFAYNKDHSGQWQCVMTAHCRNSTMSYWGDYAASRSAAYAKAMSECRRQAAVPSSCGLYGCYIQDSNKTLWSEDSDFATLSGLYW